MYQVLYFVITKRGSFFLLQNEAIFYYKTRRVCYYKTSCFYYKTRQVLQNTLFLLQNAAGITKLAFITKRGTTSGYFNSGSYFVWHPKILKTP